MTDAAAILRRHETLKSKRVTEVEKSWADCFAYTYPLRGNGLQGAQKTANSGQADQAKLLDCTAADSANTLTSNIVAGLTPANALWFGMDVGNETSEERRWLDDAATLLWENIHMANFDAEAFEACLDIVCAGQFALFIDEDADKGGFVFHQWSLASVYCASTHADGRIDIVHREYTLTAEQAITEFGEEKVPEKIRKAAQSNPDDPFTFIHALYPRTVSVVNPRFSKNLPIASCHIEQSTGTVCRESGYHEMPVVVPRWLKVPGSVYAIGPMYAALPTVRALNELLAMEEAAADIAVAGMWIAKDDGVLNARTLKLGPRKIVVASDTDAMKALETGANFEFAESKAQRMQASIRKILMADQLQPQDGPQMTAEEVRTRVDMIRKLLGPIYGRLQAEYLKPLVERCFGLAYRAGIFAAAPPSLRGRAFSVRYVSPMARAQKLDEVDAVIETFAAAAQMQPLVPDIMDELDPSKGLEIIAMGKGAPGAIRRKPEEVAKIRADRQAVAKKQQTEAAAMQAAQVGVEAAAKRTAVAA